MPKKKETYLIVIAGPNDVSDEIESAKNVIRKVSRIKLVRVRYIADKEIRKPINFNFGFVETHNY